MAFVSKAALLAISCCNAEAMAPEAAGGDGIGAAVAGAPVPAWELGVASAMTTIHTSSGNYCTPMLYPGHYTCGRHQLQLSSRYGNLQCWLWQSSCSCTLNCGQVGERAGSAP